MGIKFTESLAGITSYHLRGGFFEGWPNPPTPEAHLRILQNSFAMFLAVDESTGNVVGFITAISDGVSADYIPHLEVLTTYRGHGTGSKLVRLMLDRLSNLYMIDLTCDEDLKPFYERLGMQSASAMIHRNYDRQNCT